MKAEDNEFPYATFAQQSSNPATPASGDWVLFFKSGGLYAKNAAGTVVGPFGTSGSSLSRTQVGTTSVGGSFDSTPKTILKKVTLATDGFLGSIAVHVKGNSSGGAFIGGYVMSDNSGTPLNVIATHNPSRSGATVLNSSIGVMNGTGRWVTVPIGAWLTAGDYWLVVIMNGSTGTDCQVAYSSGTGTDRTKSSTDGPYDHSVGASSTGTNDYSIYGNLLT